MTQALDSTPFLAVFVVMAVLTMAAYEVGFRFGRWWQHRTASEAEGPTGVLIGSLLALMAFLLAVSMQMAVDRYDTRRALVQQEANAIGTTYLRAGYLPQQQSNEIRALLRAYVPLRITSPDPAVQAANYEQADVMLAQLWTITEQLARDEPNSEVVALYVETTNEMIDLEATRATVLAARVPETVILLLAAGAIVSLATVGYSAGLTGRRGMVTAVVLVVVLSAVITLIIDLDQPARGLLTVSQQPMLDLQQKMASPPS